MRFDKILPRLAPDAKYDFGTVTQKVMVRKAGDKKAKEVDEKVRVYDDYTAIIWNSPDISIPTPGECQAEWDKILAEESLERVHEKRREAYGSIGEQLDMMYWDKINGTTTWIDFVSRVKLDNPVA